jgi:hypothetical protein
LLKLRLFLYDLSEYVSVAELFPIIVGNFYFPALGHCARLLDENFFLFVSLGLSQSSFLFNLQPASLFYDIPPERLFNCRLG